MVQMAMMVHTCWQCQRMSVPAASSKLCPFKGLEQISVFSSFSKVLCPVIFRLRLKEEVVHHVPCCLAVSSVWLGVGREKWLSASL